jgi:signal transduction histidine kinase/ligand-binding sensor domain-containing protein
MLRARLGVSWIGLLALPFCLWASRMPVQMFSVAEGLPRNSVSCLTAGQTGVMWICTSEGLTRYDGSGFRVFGKESGLPASGVASATPSRAGGYWLVTREGICRLEKTSRIGEPCPVIPGSLLESLPLAVVFESATGKTWMGTGSRVYEIVSPARPSNSGSMTLRPTAFLASGQMVASMADAPDGGLYVATTEGLYEFHETPGLHQREIASPVVRAWGVNDMLRMPDGTVWLATTEGPVHWFPGRKPELKLIPSLVEARQVIQRRDGSLWFAAGAGLVRIDPANESRQDYTSKDGLPSALIMAIAEDSFGDLWGAADGPGIFRIEDSAIRTYDARDGLGGATNAARIAAIFEDLEKRLCVLTSWDGHSLRVLTNGTFQPVEIPYPKGFTAHGWGSKQNGFQAHDGEWWFPSGRGLLRFSASTTGGLPHARLKAQYDVNSKLHCDDVVRAFEDSRGDVWVSCNSPEIALMRWSRQQDEFHRFGPADNWDTAQGVALIREPNPGEIWIISIHAVHRLRGGRFESFPFDGAKTGQIQDAVFDGAGRLWLATPRGGVFRCDQPSAPRPQFQQYTVNEGLSVNNIHSLTFDREGYLYAGTVRGVDRIDPKAPISKQYIRHFTAADGLPNSEHSAAYTDSQGRVWFGTFGGLAEFNPSQAPKLAPPSIFLTKVRVRGEEIPLEWEGATALAIDLAPERNQMEVTFSGADTRPMASLRYQYRLIGGDAEWSPLIEHTTVNYTNLASGQLRFEVRSYNADGVMSASVAGIDLRVAAPIWRRWWFLALVAALLAGTVYLFEQYRLRQAMAIERLRLRIATELHDDIGANLSQIAILTEVVRRDDSKSMLAEVPIIARETVELMSDIVWAVNPRHDGFDALLLRMRRFAGDTLGAADIDLDFSEPENGFVMPLDLRRPIYLVFKEAIHNIAKHSGATSAIVNIALKGSELRMEIADNGCGLDPLRLTDGDGLTNIDRRVREARGIATWETAAGAGTKLIVTIPIR